MKPGQLTNDFTMKEFQCKCGCGIVLVEFELANKLQELRDFVGEPININSGCRCPTHNKNVGGKKTSEHITTDSRALKGADIRCRNRFKLAQGAFNIFKRVGVAKTWLHVGIDKSKPYPSYWIYPPGRKSRK